MSAATLALEQDIWRPRFNPWLIAVVVALAAFMEVLDTSIANVALPYIGGQPGREQRREHLGADVVSGVECDRLTDQRLAGRQAWAASAFS